MTAFLLSFVLGFTQPAPTRVDVIEINTYERDGEIVFRQALLRRWLRLANGSSHYVEEWRIINGEPITHWHAGKRLVTITTSDNIYTLETRSYRETRTTYDPELRERPIHHPEQRRAYLRVEE